MPTASNQGAGRAAARLGRFLLASAPVILHFVAHTGKLGPLTAEVGLITGNWPALPGASETVTIGRFQDDVTFRNLFAPYTIDGLYSKAAGRYRSCLRYR